MLHKLLAPGAWFAPKRFGYGAGWPIAWQGWALLASYIGIAAGAGAMIESSGQNAIAATCVLLIATVLLTLIARKRTAGAWRWRWGAEN